MSQAQDDLVARASDPNAELTTLHELANNYPGLRPYIAENPRTYPSLLEWLGSLGDPAVNAALARRNQSAATVAVDRTSLKTAAADPGAPTESFISDLGAQDAAQAAALAGAGQAAASPSQAVPQGSPFQQAAPHEAAYQQAAAQGSPFQQTMAQGNGYQQGAAYQQGVVHQQGPAQGSPFQQPVPQGPPYQQAGPGAQDPGLFGVGTPVTEERETRRSGLWLWILGGTVLVLVVALVVWFMSSDRGESTAAPATTTAAPAAPSPQQPTPEESPTQEPTPSPSPTFVAPAPADAMQMSTFTSPSGNIACVLGENSVSCTINEHNFVPEDPSCNNSASTPFTASVGQEGQATGNCGGAFSTQGATLSYTQSAVSGDYACTSLESGVECWSQVSGQGFRLSRSGAEPITR